MDELIRYIKKILMLAILTPLKLLPTKNNRVIMDNCLAHNYSDNIKPIAERLIKEYPGRYEIFICVKDEKKFDYLKKKNIIPLRFHSLKYYIIAMTSAFYVTNSGGYSYLPLKKKNLI